MIFWFRLTNIKHPNVVGFFGFVTDIPQGFGLVFPFFSNGSVGKYLTQYPKSDRPSLVCIFRNVTLTETGTN